MYDKIKSLTILILGLLRKLPPRRTVPLKAQFCTPGAEYIWLGNTVLIT